MSGEVEPPACDVPSGKHPGQVRLFACGYRCQSHTPAALAGRPEPAAPAPSSK